MNIYSEEIIDHYKNPVNFGKPKHYTLRSKQHNPYCGDEIEIYITIKNSKIDKISFTGHGCAISMASASM